MKRIWLVLFLLGFTETVVAQGIPTVQGEKYKLVWLEAFKPQGSTAYTKFEMKAEVFIGTGEDYQSKEYTIKPPEEFGTVEVLGFAVTLESDRAYTSPMAFGDSMPLSPGGGQWMAPAEAAKLDQLKIFTSLTIPFDRASTPEGDIEDFDVTLRVVPNIFPSVTWELVSGPANSGILLDANSATATFRNPTKGGVYIFRTTIPDLPPLYSQLWLPVSGPDISANFQDEIDFLLDWGDQYQANLEQRVFIALKGSNIFSQLADDVQKSLIASADIKKIGRYFDYDIVLPAMLLGVYGFSHDLPGVGTNKPAGDSARLVLSGESRPYVTDFAKRNNMGYAMCAKVMGVHESIIRNGPKWAGRLSIAVGTPDDPHAINSYNAGIALATRASLASVMDQYARDMQPPSMRVSKEWPDPTPTQLRYIQLKSVTKAALNALIGE